MKFQFRATNNEVEYEATIAYLQIYRDLEAKHVRLRIDSQLVVNQILGEYEAREPTMQKYLAKIKSLIALFESFEVERLPISQNEQADALFKLGNASQHEIKRSVLVEVRPQSVIHEDATSIFAISMQNVPSAGKPGLKRSGIWHPNL